MQFEEIKARYLAGETNLKAETKFLFDTQGINAVYDFARTLDEEIGSEPYNLVMSYATALLEEAKKVKENEAEKQRTALELAQKEAEKQAKMRQNAETADLLTKVKNAPLPDLVKPAEQPLFPKNKVLDEAVKPGGLGLERKAAVQPLEKAISSPLLMVGAALVLLYFIIKK